MIRLSVWAVSVVLIAWGPDSVLGVHSDQTGPNLPQTLTFHASFDYGPDADFALGDRHIYTAESFDRKMIKPGLVLNDVVVARGKGRWGNALEFRKKTGKVVFYKGYRNTGYRATDFNGTVSFWLSLDPNEDLEPGYCDPIQITDKKWNDASLFVDFTEDMPRRFRLGVFADYTYWNPKDLKWEDIPLATRPMVHVDMPPFRRRKWTHVAFTFSNYNSDKEPATAKLYIGGQLQGEVNGRQYLTWKPDRTAIMIGLSYIGLFDDLALFNEAMSPKQIGYLLKMEGGVRALRK